MEKRREQSIATKRNTARLCNTLQRIHPEREMETSKETRSERETFGETNRHADRQIDI